jgi:hypothetical protein
MRAIMTALLLTAGAALAAVPGCPHVCNGTFALCPAATCTADLVCGTARAGAPGGDGQCYIFDGLSCSYGQPCRAPAAGLVSYFSNILLEQYGFTTQACGAATRRLATCMNANCTATGIAATLYNTRTGRNDTVATAQCRCYDTQCQNVFQTLHATPANCNGLRSACVNL